MSRLLLALPLLVASVVAHAAASAVTVSPARTTVIANETQIISARFLDAQGRASVGETVRFFNDACGTFTGGAFVGQAVTDASGVASIGFTALNLGFIHCTVSASGTGGGSVTFDVITFRPDLVGVQITSTMDPPEPRPGQPIRMTATVKIGPELPLYNVNLGVRVIEGTAGAALSGTSNTGQEGMSQFTVTPDGRLGDYDIELSYQGRAVRVPIRTAANALQDLWWSGPGEDGWGMSIVQHRDMLFSIIYAYDEAGSPAWFVMPSGAWNDAHTAFTGDVFIPRGAPYYDYDVKRFDVGAPVGHATINFGAANSATLDYSINGKTGEKSLSRMFFGSGTSPLPALGDMWWGGVTQNGWGMSVLQQGRDLFTLWFTYDETGAARWFAMPAGAWVDSRTYRGALYRSAGAPWVGRTYDVKQFRMSEIGWYAMRFNEDGTATFQYSMGGGPVASLPLTRIPF